MQAVREHFPHFGDGSAARESIHIGGKKHVKDNVHLIKMLLDYQIIYSNLPKIMCERGLRRISPNFSPTQLIFLKSICHFDPLDFLLPQPAGIDALPCRACLPCFLHSLLHFVIPSGGVSELPRNKNHTGGFLPHLSSLSTNCVYFALLQSVLQSEPHSRHSPPSRRPLVSVCDCENHHYGLLI